MFHRSGKSTISQSWLTRSPFPGRQEVFALQAVQECNRLSRSSGRLTCSDGNVGQWPAMKRAPLERPHCVVEWLGRITLRVFAAIEDADCVGLQSTTSRRIT